jgi:hypothetical protein
MRHLLAGLMIFSIAALPNMARGDDQSIVQSIVQQMKQHQDLGHLKGFDISVKSNDGQVWLSGDVATPEQQTLALETARRVPGVKVVVNDLRLAGKVAKPQRAPQAKPTDSKGLKSTSFKNATNAIFKKRQPASVVSQKPTPKTAAKQPRNLFGDVAGALKKAFSKSPAKPVAQPKPMQPQPMQSVLAKAATPRAPQTLAVAQKQAVPASPMIVASKPVPAPREVARRAQRISVVPSADSHVVAVSQPIVQPAPARVPGQQQVAPNAYAQQMAVAYQQMAAYHAAQQQQMAAYHAAQYQARQKNQTPMAFAASNGATRRDLARLASAPRVMPASMYQAAANGAPVPAHVPGTGGGVAPVRYDNPNMPGYAWPSYAAHPNYAALTYPKQYSASAWPYIGPFYPYPQVPLGWRKVTLEWDDGWWMLDFQSK